MWQYSSSGCFLIKQFDDALRREITKLNNYNNDDNDDDDDDDDDNNNNNNNNNNSNGDDDNDKYKIDDDDVDNDVVTGAHQQVTLSALISWVNPFPSSFIFRTMARVEKVLDLGGNVT